MAKKIRRNSLALRAPRSESAADGDQIPAWLDRIRARLHLTPQDAARKIFLERAFEAVIEITQTLPSSALEETAAAGNNVLVLLRALQSPEILPELERYEPLASPYLKGLRAQRELLQHAGGLMTSEDVAALVSVTRQAVDKRRQSNKLIAIPQGRRGFGYPICQFDSKGPLRGLEEMLDALHVSDGWMQLTFLLSPNADLENLSPLELLHAGRIPAVTEAASRFGDHGAL
jgi:hypothetical protein